MNDATGMVRSRLMMGSTKSRNRRTRHATSANRNPTTNDSKKPSAMRPKLAPTIIQKFGITTWSASACNVRIGPASTRRLSTTWSSSSHTTSQNAMMIALRANCLRTLVLLAAARRSAAARSASKIRCASSSAMSPCADITRTTWLFATPMLVSMLMISSQVTPLAVAVCIMKPICASAMPFCRTICAIMATFSSGMPTFAAMAANCIRGSSSGASVATAPRAPMPPTRPFNFSNMVPFSATCRQALQRRPARRPC